MLQIVENCPTRKKINKIGEIKMTKKSKISALIFGLIVCALIVVIPIVGVTADASTFPMTSVGANIQWYADEHL